MPLLRAFETLEYYLHRRKLIYGEKPWKLYGMKFLEIWIQSLDCEMYALKIISAKIISCKKKSLHGFKKRHWVHLPANIEYRKSIQGVLWFAVSNYLTIAILCTIFLSKYFVAFVQKMRIKIKRVISKAKNCPHHQQ